MRREERAKREERRDERREGRGKREVIDEIHDMDEI